MVSNSAYIYGANFIAKFRWENGFLKVLREQAWSNGIVQVLCRISQVVETIQLYF